MGFSGEIAAERRSGRGGASSRPAWRKMSSDGGAEEARPRNRLAGSHRTRRSDCRLCDQALGTWYRPAAVWLQGLRPGRHGVPVLPNVLPLQAVGDCGGEPGRQVLRRENEWWVPLGIGKKGTRMGGDVKGLGVGRRDGRCPQTGLGLPLSNFERILVQNLIGNTQRQSESPGSSALRRPGGAALPKIREGAT